jgi:hypothetical protein
LGLFRPTVDVSISHTYTHIHTHTHTHAHTHTHIHTHTHTHTHTHIHTHTHAHTHTHTHTRTHTHTHTVGLLIMSDQLVAETVTYTTNKAVDTSMPSVEFEPATPAIDQPQTYITSPAIVVNVKYFAN